VYVKEGLWLRGVLQRVCCSSTIACGEYRRACCEACRETEHVTRLSKAAAACWRLERQGPSEAMYGVCRCRSLVGCTSLAVCRWLSTVQLCPLSPPNGA
jgi:hypothetical protein